MSGIGAIGYRLYPAAWSYANTANTTHNGASISTAHRDASAGTVGGLSNDTAYAGVSAGTVGGASNPASMQTAAPVPFGTAPSGVNPSSAPAAFPLRPLPTAADLNNSAEWMVRMRIQYPGAEDGAPVASPAVSANVEDPQSPAEVMEEAECQTCAKRRYQDGSDDPGVSFKTPTQMDPDQAATAVRAHEQEHVVREQAEAKREGREVVSQSVSLHTEICPECGRVYIAGGVTRTVTEAKQPDQMDRFSPNQPDSSPKAA